MHSQLGWNLSNTYQSSINSRFLYASLSINRYLSQVQTFTKVKTFTLVIGLFCLPNSIFMVSDVYAVGPLPKHYCFCLAAPSALDLGGGSPVERWKFQKSLRDSGVWQFPQMPNMAICHGEKRGHLVHHHQDVVYMLWPDKQSFSLSVSHSCCLLIALYSVITELY